MHGQQNVKNKYIHIVSIVSPMWLDFPTWVRNKTDGRKLYKEEIKTLTLWHYVGVWGDQRYWCPVRSPITVQTELPRRPNRTFILMLLLRAYERERNTFGQWKRLSVSHTFSWEDSTGNWSDRSSVCFCRLGLFRLVVQGQMVSFLWTRYWASGFYRKLIYQTFVINTFLLLTKIPFILLYVIVAGRRECAAEGSVTDIFFPKSLRTYCGS